MDGKVRIGGRSCCSDCFLEIGFFVVSVFGARAGWVVGILTGDKSVQK